MNNYKEAIKLLKTILPLEYVEMIEKDLKESLYGVEELAHKCITDIFKDCKEKMSQKLH